MFTSFSSAFIIAANSCSISACLSVGLQIRYSIESAVKMTRIHKNTLFLKKYLKNWRYLIWTPQIKETVVFEQYRGKAMAQNWTTVKEQIHISHVFTKNEFIKVLPCSIGYILISNGIRRPTRKLPLMTHISS